MHNNKYFYICIQELDIQLDIGMAVEIERHKAVLKTIHPFI